LCLGSVTGENVVNPIVDQLIFCVDSRESCASAFSA
jgi:hypothetical protein